jgi:hypothetical protein
VPPSDARVIVNERGLPNRARSRSHVSAALLRGEELVQLEGRVQVPHGQLLVGSSADELAHDAAVERVASRRPENRAVDCLDLFDCSIGLELVYDLLRIDFPSNERDICPHAPVAHPRLRDCLDDPFVRCAIEHDDLHRQLESLLDRTLDLRLELCRVAHTALEEDVSARDIGGDGVEPERLDARFRSAILISVFPPMLIPLRSAMYLTEATYPGRGRSRQDASRPKLCREEADSKCNDPDGEGHNTCVQEDDQTVRVCPSSPG